MNPDFALLEHPEAKVRFAAAKRLYEAASHQPEKAIADLAAYDALMQHANNIFKWTGIAAIGNLAEWLPENALEKFIKKLFKLLHSGQLITANHCIATLAKIANAHPQYQLQIFKNLLRVSGDTFETEECRAIAMGKVLFAFPSFSADLFQSKNAQQFVQDCLNSQRNATRKKAEVWIKKYQKV